MNINEQFKILCEDLKKSHVSADEILQKYWFSWCCPKKDIVPRSKKMANQIGWLIKSPLIKDSWYFELNNTMNGEDEYYDEISIIDNDNKNIYVLSFKYNFEENKSIYLWSLENDYEKPIISNDIKNIQRYLKIGL